MHEQTLVWSRLIWQLYVDAYMHAHMHAYVPMPRLRASVSRNAMGSPFQQNGGNTLHAKCLFSSRHPFPFPFKCTNKHER